METDERWKYLCKQASVERDPEKLVELVREINDLLGARRMQGNINSLNGCKETSTP